MGKINVTVLTAELSAVRNEGNHDREGCKRKVLHCLGFADDKSVSIPEFDAFLVRVTSERFGVSANRDIVLMAFGLLRGYHYEEIDKTENRRDKYLTDSNHQQTRARKKEPYIGTSDKRKKALRGNLRKMEGGLIGALAYYLAEHLARHVAKRRAEQTKDKVRDKAIEEYVKSRISPIPIPQPIYILEKCEPEPTPTDVEDNITNQETTPDVSTPSKVSSSNILPADDSIPEEIDEEATPPPEDDSATTGDQQDSRSKENKRADPPDPPLNPQGFRIHIGRISIGPLINIANLSWVKNPLFSILVLVAIITVATAIGISSFRPSDSPENESSLETSSGSELPPIEETSCPVEEILPTEKEFILVPGGEDVLKVAVLPVEAGNETLSFVSSDPNIVTVSRTGVLKACEDPETRGRPYQKVDITIQAESGVTKIKTVVVNFAGIDTPKISEEVEAGFYVWQQIRLAGTKEWLTTVDAEIGDIVEIQIQYRNIGEDDQLNVMVRDVLPPSLRYLAGTTKLWNSDDNGVAINDDTIATSGIKIGHYGENANAYIRFQAEVVEDGLVNGMNTLVNWAQIGVGNVTLQDCAAVNVKK